MSKAIRCSLVAMIAAVVWAPAANAGAATSPAAQYEGIEVGLTADGHPYMGAASAPVTLEEWSDYQCPFCRRHFQRTLPELVERYVRPGQVKIVFRDFPIDSLHPASGTAHAAALCAGKQAPRAFWAMHDALFEGQAQWGQLPDATPFLLNLAKTMQLDVGKMRACLRDGAATASVKQSIKDGESLGLRGTPAFRFRLAESDKAFPLTGAQPIERFAATADALLAGGSPEESPKPPPPELPFWARSEGLAPDPRRPGFTMAGDAYKGNPSAKVVVVEFADFQCPACRTHAADVQPRIDAELVSRGEVMWVSKHLPLKTHPYAGLAAVAAECAGEQGRYWPMHDLLFETVESWAVVDAESKLLELAPRAGLDPHAFRGCFAGRHALERVLQDMYDAQGLVDRVPRFIVLDGKPPGTITGALAAPQFIALLSGKLASLRRVEPAVP